MLTIRLLRKKLDKIRVSHYLCASLKANKQKIIKTLS